jgi:CheY-like chemotaxis protein
MKASRPNPIPRALVVHGDSTTRRLCRRVLEESGVMVDETDSGVGAVAAVRKIMPDVIVIDDQLRDVPGWQAAAWLRSIPALGSTAIVILGVEPGLAAEPLAVPSTTWLPKPFSARALRRIVDGALGRGPGTQQDTSPAMPASDHPKA